MVVTAPPRRRRRRRLVALVVAAVVGLAVFVAVWFQPQKLWIDDRVSEPVPTARASDTVELARGELVSRDHHASGEVRVLALANGRRILRLEGLDTSNGPDLFVYLTTTRADGPEAAFDDEYRSLGRLKGNQGDQNYEVPADADLARFTTLVIWCDRFDAAFGAADLVRT